MFFVESVGRRDTVDSGEMGAFLEIGSRSLNGYERNRLYRNTGCDAEGVPHFAESSYLTGSDWLMDGRAVAVADFDHDGNLDIALQSYERAFTLLVNGGRSAGAWLQVKLVGTRSNRDAIGARVTIEAGGRQQFREVASTAGYLAGQSLVCHFGLGAADRIDRLEVIWPSGSRTVRRDLDVNQRLEIVESGLTSPPVPRP